MNFVQKTDDDGWNTVICSTKKNKYKKILTNTSIYIDVPLSRTIFTNMIDVLNKTFPAYKYSYEVDHSTLHVNHLSDSDVKSKNSIQQIVDEFEWKQVEIDNDWRTINWCDWCD